MLHVSLKWLITELHTGQDELEKKINEVLLPMRSEEVS
jgi:hypothetical protein